MAPKLDGELLMPGRDGTAAFEPSDAALDRIAPAVEIRIEASRAALAHVATLAGWANLDDFLSRVPRSR